MADRNPWDAAQDLPCVRGNHMYAPADLEPGVKFFVLALEKLGCTTLFSCEGHPTHFYVVFRGPAWVAAAVECCGIFTVSVSRGGYRISLDGDELGVLRAGRAWTERKRRAALRRAAAAWAGRFGGLDAPLPVPPQIDALDALVERATVVAVVAQDAGLMRTIYAAIEALATIRNTADPAPATRTPPLATCTGPGRTWFLVSYEIDDAVHPFACVREAYRRGAYLEVAMPMAAAIREQYGDARWRWDAEEIEGAVASTRHRPTNPTPFSCHKEVGTAP